MLAGTFRPENIHDPPEGLGQNTQVPFLPRTFSSPRAGLVNGEENTSKPDKPKDDQVISEPRKPVRDPQTVSARDPREEIPEEGHITETPRAARQPKFTMPEAWKSGATRDPPPDSGEKGVQRPRRRSPEERRRRNEQWQLYLRREHDYATQNQSGTTPTEEGGEVEGQPQGSEVGKEVEFEKVLSSEEVVGESTPSVIEVNSSPQSEESSFHGFPSRGEEPPGSPNLESDFLQAEPDNAVREGSNPEPCLTDSEEVVERLVLAELAKQSLPPPDAGQEEDNGWADWLQILPPRTEEKETDGDVVPRETETEPEDGLQAENSQSDVPIYQAFSGRFSIPQGARPRETTLQTQTEVPSSEVEERGTSRSGEPPPGEGVSTPPRRQRWWAPTWTHNHPGGG